MCYVPYLFERSICIESWKIFLVMLILMNRQKVQKVFPYKSLIINIFLHLHLKHTYIDLLFPQYGIAPMRRLFFSVSMVIGS